MPSDVGQCTQQRRSSHTSQQRYPEGGCLIAVVTATAQFERLVASGRFLRLACRQLYVIIELKAAL